MSNGRIGDGTFRVLPEDAPKVNLLIITSNQKYFHFQKSAQDFQIELPGVFRNEEALQKYLLGFVADLSDPDKIEEEYEEWKEKYDKGKIGIDDKKTISLQ